MPAQNLLKGIAISSAMALFFKFLGIPLLYANNVIIARLWGAELLGTLMIAMSIMLTLTSICGLGLSTGLLRFVAKLDLGGNSAGVRRLFLQASGIVLTLSVIFSLGLYLSREWLAIYFKAPNLSPIMTFLALSFPFGAIIPLLRETLRGQGLVQWPTFQQYTFAPLSVLLIIGIIFAVNQEFKGINKTQALGWIILSSTILSWLFLAIRYYFYKRPLQLAGQTESIKALIRFSFPLFLNLIIALPIGTLDSLILGLCTSAEDVAYYGVAARIVPVISLPIMAVNAVVPQLFARFYERGDLQGLTEVARTSARWIYFLALPATILLIILGEELLAMFGSEFSRSYWVLMILALGQLANVAAGSCGYILTMTGNQWPLFMVGAFTAIFSLGLMALLAQAFGIYGMAVASSLGLATLNFLMALAVWRRLRVKSYGFKLFWVNLVGIVGLGLSFLTKPSIGSYGGAALFIIFYLMMMSKELKEGYVVLFRHQRVEATT